MSLIRWAGFARIIRGMVASVRTPEYVQAARALGRRTPHHRAPHHSVDVQLHIVAATLSIPRSSSRKRAVFARPRHSRAQRKLGEYAGRRAERLWCAPWVLTPGVFIFLTVMSFNFLGDHLRDRLDPRAIVR